MYFRVRERTLMGKVGMRRMKTASLFRMATCLRGRAARVMRKR